MIRPVDREAVYWSDPPFTFACELGSGLTLMTAPRTSPVPVCAVESGSSRHRPNEPRFVTESAKIRNGVVQCLDMASVVTPADWVSPLNVSACSHQRHRSNTTIFM